MVQAWRDHYKLQTTTNTDTLQLFAQLSNTNTVYNLDNHKTPHNIILHKQGTCTPEIALTTVDFPWATCPIVPVTQKTEADAFDTMK